MDDSLLVLRAVGIVLLVFGPFVFLFVHFARRRAAVDAWERSPEGTRHREALGSWLLCKARLERAEATPHAPVIRAAFEGRLQAGRNRITFIREERRHMRLQLRLLPIGAGEVVSEAIVTIPTAERDELVPGRIFSVLYDPRDPRRFYVDTLRRDESLIDAATLRTRTAAENHRASLAFSTSSGRDDR